MLLNEGTLSNAVGRVTLDTQHEETRQRLLTKHLGQSPDHFIVGLMGFGLGLYGGLTSIVAQTYTGATKEGLPVSVRFCLLFVARLLVKYK